MPTRFGSIVGARLSLPASLCVLSVRAWMCCVGLALACMSNAAGLDLKIGAINEAAQPVTLADWRGKHFVLTLAYSECRKVCTTTLKLLNDVQRTADAAGKAIEVIVVSLDPKLDTPESWRHYREMHDVTYKNWHFLITDERTTKHLANQLGMEYWRYGEHIMHDVRIVRVAPDGSIAALMDWDHRDAGAFLAGVPAQTR